MTFVLQAIHVGVLSLTLSTGSMAFVAFIPWAAVPEFVEAATPAAQAVAAAGTAAEAAAAAAPALVLGAGLLGWEIGTQLRKTFAPDNPDPFPPPAFPFRGGQGTGTYRVTVEGSSTDGGTLTLNGTLQGPIDGLRVTPREPDHLGRKQSDYTVYARGMATTLGTTHQDELVIVPYHITSITLLSGPDSDRDPPYSYLPAPVDPAILNPTIPIPGMPGSPEFPGTIVPFQRPNKTTEPPVTDPGQEEEPKVIVQIPDLGAQIEFGPTGVGFPSYNPTSDPQPGPQQDPRKVPPVPATPVCECPCDDSEVLAKLKEIKDEEDEIKDLVKPKEYDGHIATRLSGTGGSFNLQPLCTAVKVVLTEIPANANTFSGSGGPDIYIAGWHSFGGQGVSGGVRTPIQYQSSVFLPPDGATTFSYGLQIGYSAIVTEYWNTVKTG